MNDANESEGWVELGIRMVAGLVLAAVLLSAMGVYLWATK